MAESIIAGAIHWHLPDFHRTAETFLNMTRRRTPQSKRRKARTANQCTFCGKEDQQNLRTCSLCKCARYCDRQCQLADYKARHKQECAEFVCPPLSRVFRTEPVGEEQYAPRPVFARGHRDGVGCWVSVDGEYDCSLKPLAEPMDLDVASDYSSMVARRMALAPGTDIVLLGEKHKAFTRNILTLSVLVQNRRKDNSKVLVFGARVQLVSFPSTTEAFRVGRSEMDRFHTFDNGGGPRAVMSVANEPFEPRPRLQIKNLNGVERGLYQIRDDAQLPPAIHDASKGIVSLTPGEYVIYKLQFRVGDEHRITRDIDALGRLAGVSVPFTLWDQSIAPQLLDHFMSEHIHKDGHEPQGIIAPMDPAALYDYYADYLEQGKEAFVLSHFGRERLDALRRQTERLESMGMRTVRQFVQTGELDAMLASVRGAGLQDAAARLERLRARAT